MHAQAQTGYSRGLKVAIQEKSNEGLVLVGEGGDKRGQRRIQKITGSSK